MTWRAATALAAGGLLALAACSTTGWPGAPQPDAQAPVPPTSAEQDLSQYNNQQVAGFVSADPGWRAWLNAFQASDQANNAILDTSTFTTPTMQIVQEIAAAQDAYRSATSFSLSPFMVTSSCHDLDSETNGSVRLADGLLVRYRTLYGFTRRFDNGASCRQSVGFVSEVDSSRGLPIVTLNAPAGTSGQQTVSADLVWNTPFSQISRDNLLSLPDLVTLIETGRPRPDSAPPARCLLF
jgi:hypothetical protein